MWMDYGFDPVLLDTELVLAQAIGFNSIRVVLPFVVWENDRDGFLRRLEEFLKICHRRGLGVMPCLFDDCAFGTISDPLFGRQPEVNPGWYANGWTPSPGHAMVRDPQTWPRLESYVKDVIGTFQDDPRLWVWDVYNEPTNWEGGDLSLPLVEKAFQWAREINPTQPLTVASWNDHAPLNDRVHRLSDIITFHNYLKPDGLEKNIRESKRHGRPVICTEWLNRGAGSTVAGCLPILRREDVGAIHWGLVNGRTQTHLNWDHRPGEPDPAEWQHDLFRSDHTPYAPEEIALFQSTLNFSQH
jgi:hypothetical protein